MDMIAAIVGTLDKREMFQSIISHSGRQHAQFGAKPLHFAAFGDALIWGLEQQFGAAFTPEMKEAWIKLYDDVQREMMRAGRTSEDADSEQFRSVVPQFDFLDLSRDRCSAFSASFSYCFTSRSILALPFLSAIL
jgi:hypothetical protein